MKSSILLAVLVAASVAAQSTCDRTCMTNLVDRYLAQVGEGLWVGASEAPTTFKMYAVDPASSKVAFYGVMKEWDKPLIIARRLKVISGKITEPRAAGNNRGVGLSRPQPAFQPASELG